MHAILHLEVLTEIDLFYSDAVYDEADQLGLSLCIRFLEK